MFNGELHKAHIALIGAQRANNSVSNERRHEERQERPRIEVKDDMASQCGRKACKRTRPPLRDFVDVQKGTHIKNGDTCTTNRSHPLSLISHPRPSLATLVEESESAIDAKDERERSTTAIAEQDITECNRKPNEGALCNESLLSSLASINNNLCTLTLPQMALRSSSTPDLLHSNDPPHDPDPRDFSAPPATQPLTNQTTPRSAPSDRGGWEFTREPAPYPRVWALRNELDFGRKSARGVRSWRGKKSPLGTEL